ncbi:hypothetical protein TNCV_3553621 [Trichonephila clavipes]|nr:hypothetical protein TNCV_3553621 [Trichonephila clavipes]
MWENGDAGFSSEGSCDSRSGESFLEHDTDGGLMVPRLLREGLRCFKIQPESPMKFRTWDFWFRNRVT